MDKSIIILGASAVGKTTLLQELSGAVKFKYGVKKAIVEPLMIGKYVHLPEITGNVAKAIGQPLADFIASNLVITDVALKVPVGLYHVKDAEVIVLDADDDTIKRNLMSRKGKTKGATSFEDKLEDCIKYRNKCRAKGYSLYTYNEMKQYLKERTQL